MFSIIKLILLTFAVASAMSNSAQQNDSLKFKSDKDAVKNVVERFLIAAGNYDVEAMPALFCKSANIGGASLKNGKWDTYTTTFEDFLDNIKSKENPKKYSEPVSEFTIFMEGGMLAFVKADAVLFRNGKPQSNNFDYFTLIKEDGA